MIQYIAVYHTKLAVAALGALIVNTHVEMKYVKMCPAYPALPYYIGL